MPRRNRNTDNLGTFLRGMKYAFMLAAAVLCTCCRSFPDPPDWPDAPISDDEAAANLQWFRDHYYDGALTKALNTWEERHE